MTTSLKEPSRTTRPPATRRKRSPLGSKWTPYFFLGPAALYLLLFQGYPLLQELWLGFTRTSLLNPTANEWIGLDNYVKIFSSSQFQHTLWITFVYVVVCVVGTITIGLGAALLMNGNFRGRGVARALIAIPWAAPAVAVALIATWMVDSQYGIVNRVLDAVGLGVPGGSILNSTTYALPAILITTIWQLFPFVAVVLLSALQSVPKDVQESAMMDGAGVIWSFRVVTWPVIKPSIGLLALLMTIWSIRRFELIWLMTRGGPVGSTNTLVIDLYSQAFELNDIGTAAAVGMVGVVISLLVVTASSYISRKAEQENAR
ncbi:carbohydrate ABC transporter permease [Parafrigoribacterium soli]|uniref:carbohydrate ABC transporter permease n=1 Tax=Parafrigoribacterium soli TaxID=3144663 RepID=UPI0032EB6BE3